MKPPFLKSYCSRCGSETYVDASGNTVGLHFCVPAGKELDTLNALADLANRIGPADDAPTDPYDGSKVSPVAMDEVGLIRTPVLDGSRLPVNHDDEPSTWDRRKAYEAATAHFKTSTDPFVPKVGEWDMNSTPIQISHTGLRDPSVSPGVGGQVRQRRTPKPGIPHFRIQWHPVTRQPWFQPLNQETWRIMTMLLLTSEKYQYFRGGIVYR